MTDKETLEAVRFAVGGITAGPKEGWCDNLTIALCTYFEDHLEKPNTDEETEHGWHPWAEEQADSLIEAIAQAAIDAMPGWQPIERYKGGKAIFYFPPVPMHPKLGEALGKSNHEAAIMPTMTHFKRKATMFQLVTLPEPPEGADG